MALLEVKGLTKQFGGLTAVGNVDLQLQKGEIVGVIGPNGAGKTTFFNLITGFISPTSGKVFFGSKDITNLKPHRIAGLGITRTFQLNTVFGGMSVLDNLIVSSQLHSRFGFSETLLNLASNKRKEREMREKAGRVIEFMRLGDFVDSDAATLPHGQQRCLAIAIALMTDPTLLLLDEPFSGMTAEETDKTLQSIREINQRGIDIIVIEHNVAAIMALCQKIIAINFGTKIAEGTPEEIRNNQAVIEAYLGEE
jgi:branched-chain amino acid transport system ATP-binding protein